MDIVRYGKNVLRYRSFSTEKIKRVRDTEWAALAKSNRPILAKTREGFDIFVNPRDKAISRSIWVRGTYFQEDVTRVFKSVLARGDVVVDVGANVGWYALLAARRARRVFAFEPDPTSAALLHKSVQHGAFKNVEINEACVSDSDGGATLWKSDTFDGDNSIVRHTGRESIRVRSVTLDECFQDETIDLLKVDAQGAEPLIFKGAKRMIEEGRIRSVVLEWDPRYWSPEFRTLLLAFDVYDVQGRILSEMPPQKTDVLLRLRV